MGGGFVGGDGVGVGRERERENMDAKREAISPFVLRSVSVIFSFLELIWTGGIKLQ
jgi:hypothetical protein